MADSITDLAGRAMKLAAVVHEKHRAEFNELNGKQEKDRTANEFTRMDQLRPLLQSGEVVALMLQDVVTHAARLEA